MQAQSHGILSRSSSTTLSVAGRPAYVPEESVDDLAITQRLLDGPNHLGKHILVHEVPFSLDGSVAQDDSSDSHRTAPFEGRNRRGFGTSNTWTSSSGEMLSEQDEIDDRMTFVQEYNRLAKKHGVRSMVVEDFPIDALDPYGKTGNWFSRKILRRTSSSSSIKLKTDRTLRHKRSISDLSLRLKSKNDKLKDKDLQELVRLCGSSLLYLPSEYAFGSLSLPTCFRATAQYLVQHAPTARGVFRIPGSHGTVSLLYNHFCALDEGGDLVSGTVRSPTLPEHIPCDVHDVASAFKKFISGLPGGILGSLRLFDALISIQTQLHSDPEVTRTKQSKVRARLIALAIFTLKSQYRRELICAVFGLLCMIGRAAETSRREDERGRPLPTTDLMGYGPLGIVFGPLLVGDLLESYTMRLANPHGGLILLPVSPPKSRKERQKEKQKKPNIEDNNLFFNTFVDKIKVANGVTEMLITHWRDVVRHMKNLKVLKPLTSHKSLAVIGVTRPMLRPSASDTFAIRKPPDWDGIKSSRLDGYSSPTPAARSSSKNFGRLDNNPNVQSQDLLDIRKQRVKTRPSSNQVLGGTRSLSLLSPTKERSREELGEVEDFQFLPEKGVKVNRNENERISLSSRHSRLSRKDNSSETPSKLRKPRPPQNKQGLALSISKTRPSEAENTPLSIRSVKTTKNQTLGSPEGTGSLQRHLSHLVKPGLLNATSKLLQASGGSNLSREAHIPEGLVSRQIRRIAASEPTKNSISLGSPRRLLSKSLLLDSSGRVQKAKSDARSKDPLNLVSEAEDMASLQALAQVLKSEDVNDFDDTPTRGRSSTEFQPANTGDSGFKQGHGYLALISPSVTPNSPTKKQWGKISSTFSIHGQTSSETKNSSYDTVIRSPPPFSTTPKHIISNNSPVKRFGSPGHNVKALAAKFNSAVTANVFESPTRISPIKLSVKNTSPSQLRRDNLVAEYTTNTPSPTRSQKSTLGEKTPQLTRKPLGEVKPLTRPVNTRRKSITPKHSSNEISSSHSSTRQPFPSETLLQNSVYKNFHPATNLDPFFNFRTFDGHDSSHVSAIHGDLQGKQDFQALESNVKTEATAAVDDAPLEPAKSPHVHFASFDFNTDSEEVQVNSTLQDTTSRSSPPQPTTLSGTPVSRSSSVLHTKILGLQKQLAIKCEEVRQLRQQLDARATLDIGTLSEQLREAKKESLVWKSRAEISEKQVEMLSKRAIGRTLSMRTLPKKSSESSIKFNENDCKGVEKNRRALHGMDGAANSRNWTSDETTDTVIRDVKVAPLESEYSSWSRQRLEDYNISK